MVAKTRLSVQYSVRLAWLEAKMHEMTSGLKKCEHEEQHYTTDNNSNIKPVLIPHTPLDRPVP